MQKGTRGEASVVVDAAPGHVYDVVTDVTRMGDWSPETAKCEWIDGATGPAVGARFKGSNKRGFVSWSTKPIVVAAEPGREFAFEVGPDTKWTYRFDAEGNGTKITESFEMLRDNKWYYGIAERYLMRIKDRKADLERGMGETLQRIKTVIEAEPAPEIVAGAATLTLDSGLRLSCVERGPGSGPAVLLLPGPTDSWRSYAPVLDRLPRGIRAIALSQRGHGDSDKPADGYAVEDFAGDVVEVLDALDIPRCVLVGHSGSCLTARRAALDRPERVAGLVLEASPTSLGTDPALREFVGSVVLTLEDPIDPDFARSFVTDTSSERLPPELVDVVVAEAIQVPARVWRAMFSNLLEYDDQAELTDIAAPTLLIWGDGDSIVSRAMQDVLVERIPAAELLVYQGAGHTPRWEEPQRFADDLAAFAERVA